MQYVLIKPYWISMHIDFIEIHFTFLTMTMTVTIIKHFIPRCTVTWLMKLF